MSVPNSTSNPPSTSHVRGVNPPRHIPADNRRPPGLSPSPDDDRRSGLLNGASQHDDLSPEACAMAIGALSEYLESLNRSTKPNLAQDIAVFARIKQTQAEIEAALWMDADAPALWKLREALQRFLPRLARDFARPNGSDRNAVDLMSFLDQEDVRTLCHGLSVCASPSAGVLFDHAGLASLRPALQQLTDRLLERATQIGFPEEVSTNGTTLDILNWVSRALKQELIEASDEIRTAFALALPLLKEWIGASRTDAASASKVPYLTSHQLAKCAVQIDTMLKFSLIELDDDHRQALADCVIVLCEARIRTHLTRRPIDSVTIISIGNLAKDLLEADILKPAEPQHLAALAGAAQMLGCIPRRDLLAGDCRTLSNACNFLRALDEHGVPGLPGFAKYLAQWNASCGGFLECLASKEFATAWPSAQAASNLISFVKCRCKGLQKQGTDEGHFRTVRSAAHCLEQQIIALGGAAFDGTKAIGGLLSGLAYLLEAQVMADTQELRAVMAQVMKQLGSAGRKIRDAQARRTLLTALAGLLRLGAITLDEAQPALSRLLGPAASSSGRYTLQDLQRASRALGVEDEPVAVLPQELSAPTATSAASSASSTSSLLQSGAVATSVPRPGFTRIIEAPVFSSTTKTPVPSASRKTDSDWQQAQKIIKPGRTVPTLSSAPIVVAAAKAEAPSASQSESIATRSLNATPNTMNTATQRAAPAAGASSASTSQRDAGKGKAGQAQASSSSKGGREKNRKGGPAAPKKTNGNVHGNANGKAATPKQQWFALIRSGGALQDLKQLAADPAVRDARDGEGKQQRGGLFHALVCGRKDVVAWLMAPKTGYRLEQHPGPLLNTACEAIDLVDEAQMQAIVCFINALDATAKAEFRAFFSGRKALIAGVQSLLESKGLASAGPTRALAAAGDVTKSAPGQAPRSATAYQDNKRVANALVHAILDGELGVVQELLKAAPQLDQVNRDGVTALMAASQIGRLDIVRELLTAGASVNRAGRKRTSALIIASKSGHLAIVEALLKAGASVDQADEGDTTALMFAAVKGYVDIVHALLNEGALVNHANADGDTALLHASREGHLAIVQTLLTKGARPDQATKSGVTALMAASHGGHLAIVQALLAKGALVNQTRKEGGTALLDATQMRNLAIVNELLTKGASANHANKEGTTALMLASQSGHLAIVQALLNAGARVDEANAKDGTTALMFASKEKHLGIVEALLNAGAQVNQKNKVGKTALMFASLHGHLAIVQKLLAENAQGNLADAKGDTALMEASEQGHPGVVGELLNAGAQVDQRNALGMTALMGASQWGQLASVRALLHAGAQVDLKSRDGETALTIACRWGYFAIEQELRNAQQKLGQTNEKTLPPASGE